jgi:excisionase family DNA binding protein
MSTKRRTEIIVETERLIISRSGHLKLWCDACAVWMRMLTVDEAAILAGVSARMIYQWVETGRLHFAETPDGRLFICPDSLG